MTRSFESPWLLLAPSVTARVCCNVDSCSSISPRGRTSRAGRWGGRPHSETPSAPDAKGERNPIATAVAPFHTCSMVRKHVSATIHGAPYLAKVCLWNWASKGCVQLWLLWSGGGRVIWTWTDSCHIKNGWAGTVWDVCMCLCVPQRGWLVLGATDEENLWGFLTFDSILFNLI